MNRNRVATCLAAVSLLGQAVPARSQLGPLPFGTIIAEQSRPSFDIIGAGARSAGMGGAFTALADDAAAASFNPAGLALLIQPEVSLVGAGLRRQDDYGHFTAIDATKADVYGDSQVAFDSSNVNFGAFTLPFEVADRNLCIQLSYHRMIDFTYSGDRNFGQATTTSPTPSATYRQLVQQSGDIHTYNLALAYQLTQRLSLGASLSRWNGGWNFSTLDVEKNAGATVSNYFAYTQDNKFQGWNWNVGALLRYRYLNIGAMYRNEFEADYRFSSSLVTNIATTLAGEPQVRRPLVWPSSWTVGIAIKPTDTWHVTADYAQYDWSKMVIKGLACSSGTGTCDYNFFDFKLADETDTPDIGQFRYGTEYTFFAGRTQLALRAGYFHEGLPQRLAYSGHQSTLDGYSAGGGIKVGRFSVDLAYQRQRGTQVVAQFVDPRLIATGKLDRTVKGQVETTQQRAFLALLYQFPTSEDFRKALHFLFVGPGKGKDAS